MHNHDVDTKGYGQTLLDHPLHESIEHDFDEGTTRALVHVCHDHNVQRFVAQITHSDQDSRRLS